MYPLQLLINTMLEVNYHKEELQMLSKSNHVAIVSVDSRPGIWNLSGVHAMQG